MIEEKRYTDYLDSLRPDLTGDLLRVEKQALANGIPIIRPSTRDILATLLALAKPESILEVGTATGFSAIFMATEHPAGGPIVTIENYEKRIAMARENIAECGLDERITLLCGDATEILPTLPGPFDMIFMDAAKGQYIRFLPEVMRLLAPGGLLVSDNVMQDGDVISSRFAVRRRDRTIHSRMREYLYALTHTPELVTTVLPVGDGVAVSVKKTADAATGREV